MAKDLTTGKITPLLINFTIPLVLGNMFQLAYNTVDSIIVGQFIGTEALAAVGICNPITTMVILFLNGLSMGAGILMGNQFGAKDYDLLYRQISTTMIAGVIFSISVSLAGVVLTGPILIIMQVDDSIMDLTAGYLRIIFMGLIFTYLYNYLSSTLRALGDSKTPLYFLIISSVLNIFGDLFFIIVLGWGVQGCAISTVCSEALSCILCLIYIQFAVPILKLGRRWMIFDTSLLKQTISYGWTCAMQQALLPIAKLIVQAIINTMGVNAAAAFSIVNRIDDFAFAPEQSIGNAMTSFMAQNDGAGKNDRIKAGFRSGLMLEVIYGLIILVVGFLFARPLVAVFVDDEEVILLGVSFVRVVSLFYVCPSITNSVQAFFKGIGKLTIMLNCSIINSVSWVISTFFFNVILHMGFEAVSISFIVGWIATLVVEIPLIIKYYRAL